MDSLRRMVELGGRVRGRLHGEEAGRGGRGGRGGARLLERYRSAVWREAKMDSLRRMVELGARVRVRLHVEKFDRSGDEPRLVEETVTEEHFALGPGRPEERES